jgi:hypothetical protein
LGRDLETGNVGSLHDFQLPCSRSPDDERHLLSGIATISKDAVDKREQSPCSAQQQEGTVTVLNIGGMNHNVQQQAQRVDQDVPLATFPSSRVCVAAWRAVFVTSLFRRSRRLSSRKRE